MSHTVPLGLSKSRSYGGLLNHRRLTAGGSLGDITDRKRSGWLVLGDSVNSPGGTRRLLGLSPRMKVSKTPRPQRTSLVGAAVARGLRECISVTEEDITALKGAAEGLSVHSQQSQGRLYEVDKQLKSAERHLKRLEYQLSKLEELQDQYCLQQKLREGVLNMHYAYVVSPGRERVAALSNVKSGFRECTEILCGIEAQVEQIMGTLHIQMKGIQGFARLCSGDVFEITVKHGPQKWKTKGKIGKDSSQMWDSPRTVFKGQIGDVLFIKAVEVKLLGKQVLIGNKFCETKDLFSAHPQIMTINLNPSGSLKLSLIVTWDPLENTHLESMNSWPQFATASSSPGSCRSTRSSPASTVGSLTPRSGIRMGSSYGSDSMLSPDQESSHSSTPSSNIDTASPATKHKSALNRTISGESLAKSPSRLSRTDSSGSVETCSSDGRDRFSDVVDPTGNFTLRKKPNMGFSAWSKYSAPQIGGLVRDYEVREHCDSDSLTESSGWWTNFQEGDVATLRDVIGRLVMWLEDIQGQYPELHLLEQHTAELEELVNKPRSRRVSESSDISLSVESALECFDFLNTEPDDDIEFADGVSESQTQIDPALTSRTSDSGIASLTRQLSQDGRLDEDPHPNHDLVTGQYQLDLALHTHLLYCLRLIERLGTFGPLRTREQQALDKLQKQSKILGKILKAVSEDSATVTGFGELQNYAQLQVLWDRFTEKGQQLCVTCDDIVNGLISVCEPIIDDTDSDLATQILKLLVQRLVDIQYYNSSSIVTVYQFHLYFRSRDCSFEKHIEELAEEVSLHDTFSSGILDDIQSAITKMIRMLPPPATLRSLSHLLLSPSTELKHIVRMYLLDINNMASLRGQILTVYVEALESGSLLDRQSACAALAVLTANECIPQLMYLAQSDEAVAVRNQAKESLLQLGNEGQEALHQVQLSSYGFQGIKVKP